MLRENYRTYYSRVNTFRRKPLTNDTPVERVIISIYSENKTTMSFLDLNTLDMIDMGHVVVSINYNFCTYYGS